MIKQCWKISFFCTVLFCTISCADKTAPETLRQKLMKMEPDAVNVQWFIKNNMYRALYSIDGKKTTSYFQINEKWMETEREIDDYELPVMILKVIQEQFSQYELDGIEEVNTFDSNTFYEVDLIYKGNNYDILFDINGKILRKKI